MGGVPRNCNQHIYRRIPNTDVTKVYRCDMLNKSSNNRQYNVPSDHVSRIHHHHPHPCINEMYENCGTPQSNEIGNWDSAVPYR